MYKLISLTLLVLILLQLFSMESRASMIETPNYLKGKKISVLGGFLSNHGYKYHRRYEDDTVREYHEENYGLGACIESWCALGFKNSFKSTSIAIGYSNGFDSDMLFDKFKVHWEINIGVTTGYEDWQTRTFTKYDLAPRIYPSIGFSYWITPRIAPKLSWTRLPKGSLATEGLETLSLSIIIHTLD